jgi:hypothetical protein
MSARIRLTTLASVLALLAGGAAPVAATAPAEDVAAAEAPQRVSVHVRADHSVDMPRELRPGVTELTITSARVAGLQLARPAEGYTKRQAARDINRAFNHDNMRALRRFEDNTTLLGGMPTTRAEVATVTVRLRRGTYWALDTMPQVLEPGTITTFEVAGRSVGGGRLPGAVLRATGASTFGPMTRQLPRRGEVLFQNRSEVPHFLSIAKLARGKTMQDFRAWIRDGGRRRPPIVMDVGIDTGVIDGGESLSFRYRLSRGRYVLTCWWPMSDAGGVPHALRGMYRGLQVD